MSLPYNGNTRAVLVHQSSSSGGPWWIVDFTPGAGVSNPRQLTGSFAPWIGISFSFSNNPATPYYAYVANTSTIRRFDIRTMTEAPGNGWPLTEPSACWMHQSANDAFFTWMRNCGSTIVGYEPGTGTLKTYTNSGVNEPRIDRDAGDAAPARALRPRRHAAAGRAAAFLDRRPAGRPAPGRLPARGQPHAASPRSLRA